MTMRWEDHEDHERTDEQREADRVARQLARSTSVSRKIHRSRWDWGLACLLCAIALAIGVTAALGTATGVACVGLIALAIVVVF